MERWKKSSCVWISTYRVKRTPSTSHEATFKKRNQTVQIRKSLDFLIEAIVDFGTLISLVMGPD